MGCKDVQARALEALASAAKIALERLRVMDEAELKMRFQRRLGELLVATPFARRWRPETNRRRGYRVTSRRALGAFRELVGRMRELVLLMDLALLPAVVREVQGLASILNDRIQVVGQAHCSALGPCGLSTDANAVGGGDEPAGVAK